MGRAVTAEALGSEPKAELTANERRPQLYKPGQSGNPGGRPKRLAELQALSQVNFPVAVARLAELIQSKDDELAFRVIQFVFVYILGKPPEASTLAHVESMRARLTELVVQSPQLDPPEDIPPSLPEMAPSHEATTPAPMLTSSVPPEATLESNAQGVPSGLRCLYHGKDGQCAQMAGEGPPYCAPHKAKLFSMVTS